MDDSNNNTGIGDTQNTNTTPTSNDYNSVQPVSDLVSDLSGMPTAIDDNKPVEEFPNQINSNPTENNSTIPLDSVQPISESQLPDLGVFKTPQTPVMDSTTPVMPIETPLMDTPVSMPSFDTTTPVMPTEMPSMDTPVSMPSFDTTTPVMPTEMPVPTMETPVTVPTMETPVTMPTEIPMPPMETPVSMPSSDTTTNPQDLSQPLEQFSTPVETPMPAFADTEIVNTLTDEKGEKGKGGTAVVIVLIVVIVALLITIGYFAYKIFFA